MENFDELYYQDTYQKEFDAEVLSCEQEKKRYAVVLRDTAFYPEGGGQPGDTGILTDGQKTLARVLDTQKKGDAVVHLCDRPIEAGSRVHGVINWKKRFANMQGHTGEHILSGLVHAKYGYENVGFHMGETIRIDFDGPLTWEQLMEMEDAANAVVWQDIPVRTLYPSQEELGTMQYRSKKELDGKVRIIEIPGADCCACCGTHVARTGEIGLIKCLSLMNYKGGVRIELLCGGPALQYCREILERNSGIARELSVRPEETEKAVGKLKKEILEEKHRAVSGMNLYFRERAAHLAGGRLLIDFEPEMDTENIRRFADWLLTEKKAAIACVLAPRDPADPSGGYNYTIGCRALQDNPEKNSAAPDSIPAEGDSALPDLRAKAKELNAALHGRGGGKPEMIQGSFQADAETIQRELEKL